MSSVLHSISQNTATSCSGNNPPTCSANIFSETADATSRSALSCISASKSDPTTPAPSQYGTTHTKKSVTINSIISDFQVQSPEDREEKQLSSPPIIRLPLRFEIVSRTFRPLTCCQQSSPPVVPNVPNTASHVNSKHVRNQLLNRLWQVILVIHQQEPSRQKRQYRQDNQRLYAHSRLAGSRYRCTNALFSCWWL